MSRAIRYMENKVMSGVPFYIGWPLDKVLLKQSSKGKGEENHTKVWK